MKPDAIIIGSGPIGAVCARNLAEHGLHVLILEEGDAISNPPGEHLRNQPHYQNHPDDFFNEINKHCQHFNVETTENNLPGANTTKAVGGQGLLWTNNCPRAQPRERWDIFTKNEWDNYYSRAETMLQVHTNLFDQSARQQKIIDKLTPLLEIDDRTIEKIPLAAKHKDNHIHFIATRDILGDMPNITLHSKTKVTKILWQGDQATGVEISQNEEISILKADHIIIAGGAFGTTQLLYQSNIRPKALGKYLHFHPLFVAQAILKKDLQGEKNDLPPRTCIYPTTHCPWHSMILRDIFPAIATEVAPEEHLIDLQFFVPTDVQEKNQIILSDTQPNFQFELSDNDKQLIERTKSDLIRITNALGVFRKGCEPAPIDFGFAHPMGMCRMGANPKTSVANQESKIHGFKNLTIATVGLIPVSMAVNPTLTASALAIAATDTIINK